ncbi:serine/threonine-protein kinase [Haloechinothrix sp. LS1_15]|uniref:serine/threonine-protein kinase n=1 Tax=Haloechinothrix sp. LS1_15 TaxID=2652248 RepID=UPI00294445B5|nr:serine/threonine-protein kinase [Haloechinothrix sp. LS1_15]MDV6014410.1 serine/threonine protein kinase [Haloechinothrix sp. LS1_15]
MADGDGDELTGRELGRYRIDSVLGRGGMSMLYRATDLRLGRSVALKVVGQDTDAELLARFADEARNTSAIDHPNIVPVYDVGDVDGTHYIAMRLVDGSDLACQVEQGPLPPRRALDLLTQLADALDALHKRGMVHLDVKPANALVTTTESGREHVYVADFGLTRHDASGQPSGDGEGQEDFLGSPTYAAPEHLRGECLDGRTDQYALACVLYTCLVGRPPFGGDVNEVISGHLNDDPPRASAVAPTLPLAIDEVIARGMAKEAQLRYASCVALIAAARQALADAPGGAGVRPYVPSQQAPAHSVPAQPTPARPTPARQAPIRQAPIQHVPPPPVDGPVRLRPPEPVTAPVFATTRPATRAAWLVPAVAAGVLLLTLVIVLLVAL